MLQPIRLQARRSVRNDSLLSCTWCTICTKPRFEGLTLVGGLNSLRDFISIFDVDSDKLCKCRLCEVRTMIASAYLEK